MNKIKLRSSPWLRCGDNIITCSLSSLRAEHNLYYSVVYKILFLKLWNVLLHGLNENKAAYILYPTPVAYFRIPHSWGKSAEEARVHWMYSSPALGTAESSTAVFFMFSFSISRALWLYRFNHFDLLFNYYVKIEKCKLHFYKRV